MKSKSTFAATHAGALLFQVYILHVNVASLADSHSRAAALVTCKRFCISLLLHPHRHEFAFTLPLGKGARTNEGRKERTDRCLLGSDLTVFSPSIGTSVGYCIFGIRTYIRATSVHCMALHIRILLLLALLRMQITSRWAEREL